MTKEKASKSDAWAATPQDKEQAATALMGLIDAINLALPLLYAATRDRPKGAEGLIDALDTARHIAANLHTDLIEE